MGFAKWLESLFTKNAKLLLVGLDASGKTTFLYRLKSGETIITCPTIGFNVESIQYKNIHFTTWDIGGQDKIRALWKHYYQNNDGVIFMVDSTDHKRVDDAQGEENNAKSELYKLLQEDQLREIPFLILANKQDQKEALSVQQICERLQLPKIRTRPWFIQGTSCTTGEGLMDGMAWLADAVQKKDKH